jgi:transmembrane sensor
MKQQTAQEIDREAADWAARVDRGLSAAEQADLDGWLESDFRRLGAYGRIRAIALQTERVAALGPVHSPEHFAEPQAHLFSRRRLIAGGAIAASVAGLGTAGWLWLGRERFRTRRGEVRQIALQDGSVVTLNTASDLSVRWTKGQREVQFREGEALFDVARDPARPFVVVAGSTRVQVLGTRFILRALPGQAVQVLVQEGVVEVSRTDAMAPPHRLVANMRAVCAAAEAGTAPPIAVDPVPEATVRRAGAWRDGHIDFEGETLGQAVAEFARYSDTRIIVAPELAREQIAGLYQTNDPIGFARTVAESLRARTEIADGEIRIRP